MTFLTKFPRTKLFTVLVSFMATAIVWSALAWPDWTSAKTAKTWGAPDPQVQALQALAALPPDQLAAIEASAAAPPEEFAQRQVVHQTVVIRRTVPGPTYFIPDDGSPASEAQLAVAAAAVGDPAMSAQEPAPSSPGAPAQRPADPPAAVRPSAPAPSAPAPSAPAPSAPPVSAPPPAAPKPAPAPAPAPAATKGS